MAVTRLLQMKHRKQHRCSKEIASFEAISLTRCLISHNRG